ncbi:methyl-accepting chemotaxis protein [Undibacterium sp. RuRC25W]|uniref:methyl-accepting chemotaxis protein n=1 Tax=Undibacterium sp. RuRC25W TaxID=3413047 RepID=UPI003BF0306D
MNMSNLTVKFKMVMGYAIVLVCLVSVAISGLYGMSEANDTLKHVTEVNTVKMTLLEDMSNSVHIVSRVIRSLALITDQTVYDREFQKIIAARNEYDKAFTSLQGMPLDPRDKNFVDEIKKDMEVARAKNNQFLEMAKQNKDQSIVFLLADANPANAIWQDNIHSYINLQREKNKQDKLIEAREYSELRLVIVLFSVGAIVFSIAVGTLITRSLLHQLGADPLYVRYIARQLATGDLTVNIDVGKAHPNSLISAINMMRNNIAEVVTNVAQGAETISNASKEISIGNADLSMRSQTQAGAIEETASSVEELTSTVKNNADNSRQANQLAASASDIAADGGGMVNEVIATMNSISDSSKKIVDIISVIDGIAFQTNILALNAAVEAARAGEQGRGFAVVASEVRSLAQRSAIAAKEIKILISDTVEKVGTGAKKVDEAGQTIDNVIVSVRKVSDVISEISTANGEQTTGLQQIHQAINQLDQVTQQNASLVEEVAAASELLSEQAMGLRKLVEFFKLDHRVQNNSTTTKVKAAMQLLQK